MMSRHGDVLCIFFSIISKHLNSIPHVALPFSVQNQHLAIFGHSFLFLSHLFLNVVSTFHAFGIKFVQINGGVANELVRLKLSKNIFAKSIYSKFLLIFPSMLFSDFFSAHSIQLTAPTKQSERRMSRNMFAG